MKRIMILFTVVCMMIIWCMNSAFFAPPKMSKAQLGRLLFSEKILSKNRTISCASCHIPKFGFADTTALSKGIDGNLTSRNTPSVLNMKNRPYFFWDGRAETLEEQSLQPIQHPKEMGLPIKEAVKRLNENATYRRLFMQVFNELPNAKNLSVAFAAFENTLETGNSKFDDSVDDKVVLSASEERGRLLFIGSKAKCFNCHRGEDFTNDEFRNIGLFDGQTLNDSGRFLITREPSDLGKFKVPGLRNVGITAPYMHNGMFNTLEQVIEYYNNPEAFVGYPKNIDADLAIPLRLTKQEKADLVAFLHTLTDKKYIKK